MYDEKVYTVQQIAETVGVSRGTIYNLAEDAGASDTALRFLGSPRHRRGGVLSDLAVSLRRARAPNLPCVAKP